MSSFTAYGRASYGIKVHASRVTGQFGWYNLEANQFLADSGSMPLLTTSDDESP